MNVYDQAHGLAQAIKASEEFKQYDELKKKVSANKELSDMLKDFQKKQFELQAKQMMGEEISAEAMAQAQSLYGIMAGDPLCAQYLQAEMRFSLMMKDVYEILGAAAGVADPLGE